MRIEGEDIDIKRVNFVLNQRVLLAVLAVSGLSIIFGGCLAYIFSDSLFTIFCSLVIGLTIGVLLNYFVLISYKVVKNVDIEFEREDEEEPTTIMKID